MADEVDVSVEADRAAIAKDLAKSLSDVTGRFGRDLDALEDAQESLSKRLTAVQTALSDAIKEEGAPDLDVVIERVRAMEARSKRLRGILQRVSDRVERLEASAGPRHISGDS